MKPRVRSLMTYPAGSPHLAQREWSVEFDDGCGPEEEYFTRFTTALRFAYHLAMGGSRWEFVA